MRCNGVVCLPDRGKTLGDVFWDQVGEDRGCTMGSGLGEEDDVVAILRLFRNEYFVVRFLAILSIDRF